MTGVLGADAKREQRARNAEAGMKTRSGSSGTGLAVKNFPQLDWDEVEPLAEHVVDIEGKMTHSQIGASGVLTATLSVPIAYTHALVDAHLQSRQHMLFMRLYRVPIEVFLEAMANNSEWVGDEDAAE